MGKKQVKDINTVGELIERLKEFDPTRGIIVDDDGNTYGLDTDSVKPWYESENNDSPIAIFI